MSELQKYFISGESHGHVVAAETCGVHARDDLFFEEAFADVSEIRVVCVLQKLHEVAVCEKTPARQFVPHAQSGDAPGADHAAAGFWRLLCGAEAKSPATAAPSGLGTAVPGPGEIPTITRVYATTDSAKDHAEGRLRSAPPRDFK